MHDQSFAAAYAANIALSVDPLVSGYSFWTFTDIFDEKYFSSVPFHGGFGLLNLHGVPKPVYRTFELLHGLRNWLYPVRGSHGTVDVWVSKSDGCMTVLVTNYAMPRHEIAAESERVRLVGARRPVSPQLSRIDEDRADPRRAWQELGEPDFCSMGPMPRAVCGPDNVGSCGLDWSIAAVSADIDSMNEPQVCHKGQGHSGPCTIRQFQQSPQPPPHRPGSGQQLAAARDDQASYLNDREIRAR